MRELLSTQESHRSMFDDLNAEFNAYKETRSSQIDSLVAAQNLLMANIKTQESKITFLRDEVEKRNLEIKRHEDLADKAHRRAETLTSKLKEAVDEIQKATNCILEERQTNTELELEMEIAVKSLEQLETRNQTLEDEAKVKGIELNTVKEENEKLVEQIKGAQADLSFQTTELENARCYSDELQRQLYEVVDKCENAVKIVEGQQTDINNLTNDLKVKEENIMLLENQICDIKISFHVVQEDSAKKDKELHAVKEKIEKLSHHIKGAQADLSFQTTELENVRRHSDELQRQVYDVVDKYENAVKIINDQQIVINNLENDSKMKDDSIMLLKEQMYELKISHRTAQEDSVSLAKTLKLINLCLLSTDSNERRLDNGNRANKPEEIARNHTSDESFMIQGQSFINEKQWSRVSSPSNTKDSSFRCDIVSRDLKSKPIYRSVQSETPRFNESRFDFDGDNTVKEEESQFHSYSMRSPPPSPSSRNVSNLAQSVGQREDSVMALSRMIQDLSSDRRGSMDIEQANCTMPKYD
jgi:chromosome segregation ATPase